MSTIIKAPCPHCGQLNPFTAEFCYGCGSMLDEEWNLSRISEKDNWVPCPYCRQKDQRTMLRIGAQNCWECDNHFSEEYWRLTLELAAKENPSKDPDISELLETWKPTDLGFETWDWFDEESMLCCEQQEDDCGCGPTVQLRWEDALETVSAVELDGVYYRNSNSACASCLNYYSFNCQPFRLWLWSMSNIGIRTYKTKDGTDPELAEMQIDRCSGYVNWEEYRNRALEAEKKVAMENQIDIALDYMDSHF